VGKDRRPGDDRATTDQATGRTLTVPEAAEVLGITGDAVRSRIKRGTLPTVREGGRVFVVVGGSEATDRPTAQAQPTHAPGEDRLYQEMQERIRYLESQVEEEREARRRADTLLARLMDRLPELESPREAPPETPGSPPEAAEEPERAQPRPDSPGPQEGVQRPWWRRMFGR
jgi:excisionase family DNA binding protein